SSPFPTRRSSDRLGEHPGQVEPVERGQAAGGALDGVGDRVRRGELTEVHVLVRREDQRQAEGRVLERGAPEMTDGAPRVELHHAIEALDELLVRLEAG